MIGLERWRRAQTAQYTGWREKLIAHGAHDTPDAALEREMFAREGWVPWLGTSSTQHAAGHFTEWGIPVRYGAKLYVPEWAVCVIHWLVVMRAGHGMARPLVAYVQADPSRADTLDAYCRLGGALDADFLVMIQEDTGAA